MARRPDWVKPVETSAGRRYEVRVHGQRPDGSRFQHKKRFESVEAAVKWRSTVVSELAHGTHVAPSELTVKQAVESWLLGQRIRPKTMSAYVTSLRPLVDALGDRPVQQVTKDDIEAVVQSLRDGKSAFGMWRAREKITGGKATRDKWSAASINPMLARTRSVFSDLMDQGVLVRNVAALVKSLPTEKSEMHTLDAGQVQKLLTATAGDAFGIAWRLAVLGLRRGEILALAWDAIDFEKCTLAVTASRLATAGGATTGAPKTKSSIRALPMPEDLVSALRRERKRQKELQLLLGTRWPGTGLVVVDDLGVAPYPDTLTKAWKKALVTAGLPHVRLHDARHSCATLMHLNGVPAVVIAAWLGHQDPGFTLRTYAHSTDSALSDAAATIGGITTAKKKDAK